MVLVNRPRSKSDDKSDAAKMLSLDGQVEEAEKVVDPFNMEETDPAATGALGSSLWEIKVRYS